MKNGIRSCLVVLLLVASPETLPQYKCITNGQTTYSERPCGPNAVNMAPSQPRRPDEPAAGPPARPITPQAPKVVTIEKHQSVERSVLPPREAPTQEDHTLLFVVAGFAVFIYFAPTINALLRRHSSTAAIVCLNMILGWTFLGWALALVWSYSGPSNQPAKKPNKYLVACSKCGETVGPNAQFCERCGSVVASHQRQPM